MIESRPDKTFVVKILPVQFLGTQVKSKEKEKKNMWNKVKSKKDKSF